MGRLKGEEKARVKIPWQRGPAYWHPQQSRTFRETPFFSSRCLRAERSQISWHFPPLPTGLEFKISQNCHSSQSTFTALSLPLKPQTTLRGIIMSKKAGLCHSSMAPGMNWQLGWPRTSTASAKNTGPPGVEATLSTHGSHQTDFIT